MKYKVILLELPFFKYIEDIWVFQCKIEFHFTVWSPQAVFSRVAVATSENIDCGIHERNKIQFHPKKLQFSVSFMLLFAIIMFYLHVNSHVRTLTFFLAIRFRPVQRV